MFDVSFFELAAIGLVALLALGPERLPGAARTLGALVRRARSSWFNLKHELEREIDAEALRRPFGDAQREVQEPFDLLGKSLREVSESLDPKRLTRKAGLLSDSPVTDAALATMGPPAVLASEEAMTEPAALVPAPDVPREERAAEVHADGHAPTPLDEADEQR